MNHNLEDRANYPQHHVCLTATNINLYTQGIAIKVGDTIKKGSNTYIVQKVKEDRVVALDRPSRDIGEGLIEKRTYLTPKTRFFIIKYEGQIQFSFTQDRHRIGEVVEYNIPTPNRNVRYR